MDTDFQHAVLLNSCGSFGDYSLDRPNWGRFHYLRGLGRELLLYELEVAWSNRYLNIKQVLVILVIARAILLVSDCLEKYRKSADELRCSWGIWQPLLLLPRLVQRTHTLIPVPLLAQESKIPAGTWGGQQGSVATRTESSVMRTRIPTIGSVQT